MLPLVKYGSVVKHRCFLYGLCASACHKPCSTFVSVYKYSQATGITLLHAYWSFFLLISIRIFILLLMLYTEQQIPVRYLLLILRGFSEAPFVAATKVMLPQQKSCDLFVCLRKFDKKKLYLAKISQIFIELA